MAFRVIGLDEITEEKILGHFKFLRSGKWAPTKKQTENSDFFFFNKRKKLTHCSTLETKSRGDRQCQALLIGEVRCWNWEVILGFNKVKVIGKNLNELSSGKNGIEGVEENCLKNLTLKEKMKWWGTGVTLFMLMKISSTKWVMIDDDRRGDRG